MQRKRYSKEFKAQVAIAAIKGQKTANEVGLRVRDSCQADQ